MANRPPTPPPPRDFNWGRVLRTLSFWALLIVGSVALVQFAASRREQAIDMSTTQYEDELARGNVAAVEISERDKVRGILRRPLTIKNVTSDRFTVALPYEMKPEEVRRLLEKGVEVRA